jgi:hypothetical protein
MQPTNPHPPVNANVAREEKDVRTSAILWFGFWLIVAAALIHVGLWGLFQLFAAEARSEQPVLEPNVAASLKRTPSEPRLEPLPLASRRALRAAEDARLSGYAWVDRPGGVARIPIARAMRLIVERGVPGGKPFPVVATPAPAGTPTAAAPGSSNR